MILVKRVQILGKLRSGISAVVACDVLRSEFLLIFYFNSQLFDDNLSNYKFIRK
jgi:hypothetical protein